MRIPGDRFEFPGKPNSSLRRRLILSVLAVFLLLVLFLEMRTSWMQSRVFAFVAAKLTYAVAPGQSAAVDYPNAGPYDQRLGYSRLPAIIPRLESNGFQVKSQARASRFSYWLRRAGLFPIYHRKNQAGLTIVGRQDRELFQFLEPRRVYPDFPSIPPLVVQTLLYIENRSLLDPDQPYRNPVIEWDRLGRATVDFAIHQVDGDHPVIGGSTLASQLEKLRHSPEGRTGSPAEKLRQILSASLRVYQDGPRTLDAQQRVVLDYINSIPLAAAGQWGEVTGLADGLAVWYRADFDKINRLLTIPDDNLSAAQRQERALAYRQVLSLFLAMRQPTRYLRRDPAALNVQTDRYLRALARDGVIPPALRDAALGQSIRPYSSGIPRRTPDFAAAKASDGIRAELLQLLDVPDFYSLDRFDLRVQSTIDHDAQRAVTSLLSSLAGPESARKAGIVGDRMLTTGDPAKVNYAVILYERGNGHNLLRVQADNLNQPLRINDGTRLQLGSTAKLRTLIHYLEIVEQLHGQLAARSPAELAALTAPPGDRLTAWAVEYLSAAKDRTLDRMLEAALDRKYSGSPGEAFFTAGGLHYFGNYERSEDGRFFTVREAFAHSVNLAFIRIMRDIEGYYLWRVPGASPSVLTDPNDPARERYLRRFADQEGEVFLRRFFERYNGQSADDALAAVLRRIGPTPLRAAVIFRSVRPDAGAAAFHRFLNAHVPEPLLRGQDLEALYFQYGRDKFNLADRGYLANIHPLELWLLEYVDRHPRATLPEVLAASTAQRQEVYGWLFRPTRFQAQNKRIRILLEQDAFQEIGKAWRRLGYPFADLVPSYATAIGVSGDTPKALAELAGIVLNDGVRYGSLDIRELAFARQTPMEAVLAARPGKGERVLSAAIAAAVRRQMASVVESGTAQRARGAFVLPGGAAIPVAGKTGTGDNRHKLFTAGGAIAGERVVNRTATFVFLIGDRFFGTITTYVPGQDGASYRFTSALPVQLLKTIAPDLMPMLLQPAEPKAAPTL